MPLAEAAAALREEFGRGATTEGAFVSLYAFLDGSPNGRFGWLPLGQRSVTGVNSDRHIHTWKDALRRSIDDETPVAGLLELCGVGEALNAVAASGRMSAENSRDLVLTLRTLDSAFLGVHSADTLSSDDSPGLARLRSRLWRGEPLMQYGDLNVFPRPSRHMFPEVRGQSSLSELLDFLTVVRTDANLSLDYQPLFDILTPGRDEFRRIGIIPAIHSAGELAWSKIGDDRYSIAEAEPTDLVANRVCRALTWLAEQGVDLVLLPELVSGPQLVAAIAGHLGRMQGQGLTPPAMVLAGTHMTQDESGHPRNRAVLLDSDGAELWTQDKLHAYRFTADEQRKAGHPLGEDDVQDRNEQIAVEPRPIVVKDLSAATRVVVLTCEDFIQDRPHRAALADIDITALWVPVMSGPRPAPPAQGWINDAAMNYVRHPGATSLVANSGALLDVAHRSDHWQYSEVRASPRTVARWESMKDEQGLPIAWLGVLDRAM